MSNELQSNTLRLFDGQNSSSDWHTRGKGYSKNEIDKIKDPAAGSTKEVTSIPSPFARFHLFEDAFKSVTTTAKKEGWKKLEEISAYHMLVSESLDVAETLFNYQVFNNQGQSIMRILRWNKKDIEALKSNGEHSVLGSTLELFLKQDGVESNFDDMQNIYLLFYDNTLIGATSPSTLFIGAHNPKNRLARLGLVQGDHKFFGTKSCPLYKRSTPFLKYMYGMFEVYPELKKKLKIIWSYLEVNLKAIEHEDKELYRYIKNTIQNDKVFTLDLFREHLNIDEAEIESGKYIEILPRFYHFWRVERAIDYSGDDFAIASKLFDAHSQNSNGEGVKAPLVLQEGFSKPLKYGAGNWNPEISVPKVVHESLDKRVLPGRSERYPWFTVSDFLEPYLMKLAFVIDEERFFSGNPENFKEPDLERGIPGDYSYLLPIKRAFFEYFTPDYLKGKTGGKPNFKMRKVGTDSVNVQLRIPIKSGDVITFERMYHLDSKLDLMANEGVILESRFNLGVLPNAYPVDNEMYQHLILVDADTLSETMQNEYEVKFYTNDGRTVTPDRQTKRSDKKDHVHKATSKHYVIKSPYDYIQISNGKSVGIVIPETKGIRMGNDEVVVAVDFGTTNTYIAFAYGNNQTGKPFTVKEADRQLYTLHDSRFVPTALPLDQVINHEMPPRYIGENQPYWFPIRTAVTELGTVNHSNPLPIGDIKVAFLLERLTLFSAERVFTNLKWLKLDDSENTIKNNARISSFLAELMILIRNKIILEDRGDLKKVKLVWFYPSSLGTQSIGRFERIWKRVAKDYLSEDTLVEKHPESLAPFYAYDRNTIKGRSHPVVNIDIGGGTTDVAVFENKKPNVTTSFRFAGNSVFGDGLAKRIEQNNGFVRKFFPIVKKWLEENKHELPTLRRILMDDFSDKMASADINAFFFSLEKNNDVKKARLEFSYANYLSDDEDSKMVFVVFAGAIFYHLAKLMKTLDKGMPRQILFSGKGANILRLLDVNNDLKNAAVLAKSIFEEVYGQKYHDDGLDLICKDKPKEVTCLGGINMTQDGVEIEEVDNLILLGDEYDRLNNTTGKINYPDHRFMYGEVDDDIQASVLDEVNRFIDMIFKICEDRRLIAKLGLNGSRLGVYKKVLRKDLRNHLLEGLEDRMDRVSDAEGVSESLFFYPLIGGLYQLTQLLVDEE